MPYDYPVTQLVADVVQIVADNTPTVIAVAVALAGINLVIGWFMHILNQLATSYKG